MSTEQGDKYASQKVQNNYEDSEPLATGSNRLDVVPINALEWVHRHFSLHHNFRLGRAILIQQEMYRNVG